jgi:hypothetical protein
MTKHVGFYSKVDGQPIHIYGDPTMSDETLQAIQEVAKAAMKMMQNKGKRHDLTSDDMILDWGEYGKSSVDNLWHCRPPQKKGFYCGMANLGNHNITEHEDGTITVSPSILITGHHGKQWHGYLERGIWREV